MDTVRSKRKNKTLWIFGGSVAVVVFIVILILCLTLSGGDADENERPTVSTQTSTQGELGTVPEAFRFLEEVLIQTLDHTDKKEKEYFDDFMTVKWKVMKVLAEKADAEDKKKSGKTKKTSESGTSTKEEAKPAKPTTGAGASTAKTTTAQGSEGDKTSAAKTEPQKANGKAAQAAPTAKTPPEAKVEPEVEDWETTAEDLSDTESVYDTVSEGGYETGSEGGYEAADELYGGSDQSPGDGPKVIPQGAPPAKGYAEETATTDGTPKSNLKGNDGPAGTPIGVWTYTKNKATGAWEYVKNKGSGAKSVFTGSESAFGNVGHA